MHGGDRVAKALAEENVRFVFTLCGGHISPILVASRQSGIRVIDTRHEANAVFAADAVGRLTGVPGVAAVTAGPGITNTITAVRNALMAQSPLVLLGGAAPTLLKGRGALQDIDQMALIRPNVKWAAAIRSVRDIYPMVKKAFRMAREGVPGPVFVELPLDVLYDEQVVREGFEKAFQNPTTVSQRISAWYIKRHLDRVFKPGEISLESQKTNRVPSSGNPADIQQAIRLIQSAERPVVVAGSGALLVPTEAQLLSKSLQQLGMPVYLSGMARGLLGAGNPLQYRHHRKEALREADLVLLAGVPCDFRLDYGRQISSKARLISINRSKNDLVKNRKPTLGVHADPLRFLWNLSARVGDSSSRWKNWKTTLNQREQSRENTIHATGPNPEGLDAVSLFLELEKRLPDTALFVADGGDFVGTASYILRPRTALSWLDPGAFGTLGIGGGFALGAKLCRPESEVAILYGDGSAAYSLAEFDTFVRHRLPVIAIIGNDASWSQIDRDQVDILKDDCGTVLAHSDYEKVAIAFGGKGRRVSTMQEFASALAEAQESIKQGIPFLINAIIQKSDFRKGSLSM